MSLRTPPAQPSRERRSFWRIGPESTWTTVLPVAFIIVSLVSLLVLPIVVLNHTQRMRQEITRIAEPARRVANQIQVDLSSELDKIIAYQVTGQENFRLTYVRLVQQQLENRKALLGLAPKLGGGLERDLGALFVQSGLWHEGVRKSEFLDRQLPAEVFQTRLFEQHPTYEKSLLAASQLELELQSSIDERLQSIREAERWNFWVTVILAPLALTSALLVAGLGRQMRLLAAAAMSQRKDAQRDATDAQKARAEAERQERRAAFLAAASQELAASLDLQQTIATVARLVVPNLAEMCVIDIVESNGVMRRAAVRHSDPQLDEQFASQIDTQKSQVPEALVRMLQAREAKLVGGTSALYEYATGQSNGKHIVGIVPLISRGQALGVMIAVASPSQPFAPDDLTLLTDLGRHASLAVDNARLYLESQQAVRAREEVLAIVSHDLRNPLNAVMLAAGLLKMDADMGDEGREQIDTIGLSAKRMSRLIADLLDVTRLEGGKQLPITPEQVEVPSLLEEAHELFKAQAAANSVTLQHRADENLLPIYADRHRVMQVLSNLIGNALKFTPPGGVVSFSAILRGSDVLFTVSDTGPGIPKEHLDDVFSPYWQAKRTERMGAGLGLPIAKGIVESHGGRIWIESEPGVGTKFHFTIPVYKSAEEEQAVTLSAHRSSVS